MTAADLKYFFDASPFRHHFSVSLSTIPELSAESCMEIVSSEEEKVVSGLYWLNFRELGIIKVIALPVCREIAVIA